MNRIIRTGALAGAAVAAVLVAAGCTPAGKAPAPAAVAPEPTGTIEFWHFFTDREANAIEGLINDFRAKYPKVTVTVKSGQDDTKMLQAIGAGTGPDVGLSYSTDIVGKHCATGAWGDLQPYVGRDQIDLNKFPATVRSYTEFRGKRCSMPFLADTYGFYYNKKMLADAGFANPPKTLSELTTMAKALTKRKADGTIERAGFLPLWGFYEFSPSHFAPVTGAKWLKDDGTSAIGTDPAWQEVMRWQKDLVDWYGYQNLEKFRASLGDEWSADHAFHKGQIAMMVDGEYRIAFLRDQAKDVDFGTAPMPVADSQASRYGAGYVTGNVIGISRNSKNPEAAWALIRYLTTDTGAIVKLANGIKNVPTTTDALASPDLEVDPAFKTFLDIFNHPETTTTPASAVGPAYQETFSQFLDKWQSGGVTDINTGLADVDRQVNQLIQLAG
jgi:multiple sugar transport system substrate-binding protein